MGKTVIHVSGPALKKWTVQTWLNYFQKEDKKKRFQYCLDPNGNILYMRATQGHSGRHKVDLSLQDTEKNPVQLDRINKSGWFFPILAILVINQV